MARTVPMTTRRLHNHPCQPRLLPDVSFGVFPNEGVLLEHQELPRLVRPCLALRRPRHLSVHPPVAPTPLQVSVEARDSAAPPLQRVQPQLPLRQHPPSASALRPVPARTPLNHPQRPIRSADSLASVPPSLPPRRRTQRLHRQLQPLRQLSPSRRRLPPRLRLQPLPPPRRRPQRLPASLPASSAAHPRLPLHQHRPLRPTALPALIYLQPKRSSDPFVV